MTSYRFCVMGALCAVFASAQTFPASLISNLSLTAEQVQLIVGANKEFAAVTLPLQQQYVELAQSASTELAKSAPDALLVGDAYARMEKLRREFAAKQTDVQGRIAGLLTSAQVKMVGGLVDVARLREIVYYASAANLVKLPAVDSVAQRQGDFSGLIGGIGFGAPNSFYRFSPVQSLPFALVSYLQLTEAQIAAIEVANAVDQADAQRQSLKVQQLQYEIKTLTDAAEIDAVQLGLDYVAMAQIQNDRNAKLDQVSKAVRGMLTPQQAPQLRSLDNAAMLLPALSDAVCNNLLVLPADVPFIPYGFGVGYATSWFNTSAFVTALLGNPYNTPIGYPLGNLYCVPATSVPAT